MSQGQIVTTPSQQLRYPRNIPSDMSDASSVSTLTYDTSMFHLAAVQSSAGKERNFIHHVNNSDYSMGLRASASARINAIVHRSPARGCGIDSNYNEQLQHHQAAATTDDVRAVPNRDFLNREMNISARDASSRSSSVGSSSVLSSSPTNSQDSTGISYDSSSSSGDVGMAVGRRPTVARSLLRTASQRMMRLKSVNEGAAEISESAVFV